jgi:hypothetical protein
MQKPKKTINMLTIPDNSIQLGLTHPEQVTLSLAIFRALVCNRFIQQCLQLTIIQVGHIRVLVFWLQAKCNFLFKKDNTIQLDIDSLFTIM